MVKRVHLPLLGIVGDLLQHFEGLLTLDAGLLPGARILRVEVAAVAGCGSKCVTGGHDCVAHSAVLGVEVIGAGAVEVDCGERWSGHGWIAVLMVAG